MRISDEQWEVFSHGDKNMMFDQFDNPSTTVCGSRSRETSCRLQGSSTKKNRSRRYDKITTVKPLWVGYNMTC